MKDYSHIKLDEGEVLVPENVTPNTPVSPVEDRHGRPKWVNTRQCWCAADASTDCRFHSMTEVGWEVCPSKPEYPDSDRAPKSRWLCASNPDYGKPMPKETAEVVVEEATA